MTGAPSGSKPGAQKKRQDEEDGDEAEEHTGITDDEAEEEGDKDYDILSRMTLKVRN